MVEPNFFGAIEVETGKAILFMPRYGPDHAIWYGPVWTTEDFRQKYKVDEVHFVDEVKLNFTNYDPLYFKVFSSKMS